MHDACVIARAGVGGSALLAGPACADGEVVLARVGGGGFFARGGVRLRGVEVGRRTT